MSDASENQKISSSERNTNGSGAPKERASESSREDDVFVQRALKGDKRAYNDIVNKYERALYYHILKMVRDREMVEDLVQETFMKAFDNINSYNSNYAFSTWLYRIATNHTIDYLRKKKLKTLSIDEPMQTKDGEMDVELPDHEAETDDQVMRKQRHQILNEAIENLPEKYRRVIQMRHMEELSYQEISETLDLPLGTVKAHIFRARELLYKALKDRKKHF